MNDISFHSNRPALVKMGSTSSSKTSYEVFLSFRGADTRDSIASHLYKRLVDKNIETFMDNRHDRGEDIESSLMKVIEESKISVIVFSMGYASSPWCLDELVKILECRERMGQTVLPIFYFVDPCDVEQLTGIFGDGFRKLEAENSKSMDKWRNALKEAAALWGWDSKKLRPDSKLIDEVVKDIVKKISPFQSTKKIVSMASSFWKMMKNVFRSKNYYDILNGEFLRKLEELRFLRDNINMNGTVLKNKKRKREVESWLCEVDKFIMDVECIEQDYLLKSSLKEMGEEVSELLEKGRVNSDLLMDGVIPSALFPIPTSIDGEKLPMTMESVTEEILVALNHDSVNIVAIYGLGGIGKTTIAKFVYNKLLKFDSHKFNDLLWVTASASTTGYHLQHSIARAAGLDLSNIPDEAIRAAKLHTSLLQKKRFLLILDDMRELIPLENLGICTPVVANGSKILITSRSLEVCKYMNCQPMVKLGPLTEDEAWSLFSSRVGREMLLQYPDIEHTARLLSRECHGLPLAIIVLATHMRGLQDPIEWRNTLVEIRGHRHTHPICEPVIQRLKLSYDSLKDLNLRQTFLYCALFPVGFITDKDRLIDYWISEGFIKEKRTRLAQFDKGHSMLRKLQNNGLLEVKYSENLDKVHINMHNLIRDMAINIAHADCLFMAKPGANLTELPEQLEWTKNLKAVSLMCNSISKVPSAVSPCCPRLSTLMLQHNPLRDLPPSFFTHLSGLQVLDLSHTLIETLPDTISNLRNLTALHLEHCRNLRSLPSLASLSNLEVLNLKHACIFQLPDGMKNLANLKVLDLFALHGPKMIPTGLISRLALLQCLRTDESDFSVDAEELMSLTSLEILGVRFSSIYDFEKYVGSLHWKKLHRFHLQVGDAREGNYSVAKGIYVDKCASSDSEEGSVRNCSLSLPLKLLNTSFTLQELILSGLPDLRSVESPLQTLMNLQFLKISKCPSISSLVTAGTVQNLKNLDVLSIEDCQELKEIIVEGTDKSGVSEKSLPRIEILKLRQMEMFFLPKLKSIYKGVMICDSLQSIMIWNCMNLRRLPILEDSVNLQKLCTSALKVIKGQVKWWESLQWDYPDTKIALQPIFKEWVPA